jgi:hypothetical protein
MAYIEHHKTPQRLVEGAVLRSKEASQEPNGQQAGSKKQEARSAKLASSKPSVRLLDVQPGYSLKMLEIECVQAGRPPKGRRGDQTIGDIEAGTQSVSHQQIVCCRELGRLGPENRESTQEPLDPFQVLSTLATHHQLHGGNTRNCEGIACELFQPSSSSVCAPQAIDQNVGVDKGDQAGRFQPFDRSFSANSEVSSMSARSRHMPKNSEFSRSPKVEAVEGPGEETVTAIAADPAGTSAGRTIRNSRLAGISVLKVTVFTMAALPQNHASKADLALTTDVIAKAQLSNY